MTCAEAWERISRRRRRGASAESAETRRPLKPRGQLEAHALGGHVDDGQAVAETGGEIIQPRVGAVRAMVEEHHAACSGAPPELDGVVGDGVTEAPFDGKLLRAAAGSRVRARRRCGRARAQPRGTRRSHRSPASESGGAVVGHVGERGVPVADPVAEGPPALVGDLAGEHRRTPRAGSPGSMVANVHVAAQLAGLDREVAAGTSTRASTRSPSSPLVLVGQQHRARRASSRSPAAKNGRPRM